MIQIRSSLGAVFLVLGLTAGCETFQGKVDESEVESVEDARVYSGGSVFGDEGITFGGPQKPAAGGGSGIGVNSFLWRATLDTISFMPINSADPFGGVILTDWRSQAEAPGERFKLNVYILGRALRADGVRVAVFRQEQDPTGLWRDAAVPRRTSTAIEDAILTRARQLRNETLLQ